MSRRLWMSCLCLSSVLVAACTPSVPMTVRVNQNNNGEHVTLATGQHVVIELPRGADPQYTWTVNVSDKVSDKLVLDRPTKQVLELANRSTVIERYIFTALHSGNAVIHITELPQYGLPGEAKRDFNLFVTVKPQR